MGVFRTVGHTHFDQQGGDIMINIGIDVHKKTCVATIKGRAAKTLEQTEFSKNYVKAAWFF